MTTTNVRVVPGTVMDVVETTVMWKQLWYPGEIQKDRRDSVTTQVEPIGPLSSTRVWETPVPINPSTESIKEDGSKDKDQRRDTTPSFLKSYGTQDTSPVSLKFILKIHTTRRLRNSTQAHIRLRRTSNLLFQCNQFPNLSSTSSLATLFDGHPWSRVP